MHGLAERGDAWARQKTHGANADTRDEPAHGGRT